MAIKQRSPNYPGVDLGEAIEAIRALYPKVQRGEFTVTDAATVWGYSSASGPVRRKMGALRQYGLIIQKKGDNARLSDRALTLILRNQASNEHRAALRQAALCPLLFQELYEAGKHTAANDALLQHLVVERAFTDDGAAQFIEVLRATLALAGLTDGGIDSIMSGQEEDKQDEEDGAAMTPPSPPADARAIQLPVSTGEFAVLQAAFPLTEQKWKQMLAVLNAMKPALVTGDREDLMEETEPELHD